MEALLKSLAQHSDLALLVLAASFLLLAIAMVRLRVTQRKEANRWRELLRDSQGESLEQILAAHLQERKQLAAEVDVLRGRITSLESALEVSKRHLGLVRFDAFEEVHGNQSFALAIYDDQGNGAVMSGIVGRTDCRVFCKPLVSGRSERNLSQEEQRAIREALSPGVKSIVSP